MEEKPQPKQPLKIKGYLYLLVESFEIPSVEKDINCSISLGENAKCETKSHKSGNTINEVFLVEVPEEDTTRLVAEFKSEGETIGECRFDVNPFFSHVGNVHTINSDINSADQEKKGSMKLKITYYSAEHGKLRIRVFSLSVVDPIVEHYQKAKLKLKIGIYAQSSALWDMKKDFDETLELLVLTKNGNL